ncbi:MAG: AMP-binding protein, partial [Planctomycetes bacterium]|nr:AMP-binding protein [Planctomycetota bacterium]
VNDNETGSITSERQEPTTTTTISPGSDTPIVDFKDYVSAGTTLEITPHISESDFLQLEINLTVDSFEGEGTNNVPPPKSTNVINTLVTVPNGMTIILGGLTSQNDGLTENKVPLLGDIPILGALFRNVSRSESEGVLYVFVRAEIVRKPDFSDLDENTKATTFYTTGTTGNPKGVYFTHRQLVLHTLSVAVECGAY